MWRNRLRKGWSAFRQIAAVRSALQWFGWWDTVVGGGKTIVATTVAVLVAVWARLDSQPRSVQFVVGLVAFTAVLVVIALVLHLFRQVRAQAPDKDIDDVLPERSRSVHTKQRAPSWSIASFVVLTTMLIVGLLAPPRQVHIAQVPAPGPPKPLPKPSPPPPSTPTPDQRKIAARKTVPVKHAGTTPRTANSPASLATTNNAPNGTPIGSITVQPGAVVSFGQQGGQTAGTIINNGPPPPPTPNVSICISTVMDAGQYNNVMNFTTDTTIMEPWYALFFDGPVLDGKASMGDHTFGYRAGRADKLPGPEKSVWVRFTNIDSFGTSYWLPAQEITVIVPSKQQVRLVRILGGSGEDGRIENFKYPCGNGF